MRRAFLRWLIGWCEWHDVSSAAKIAELEVATGIDPEAVERRWRVPIFNRFDDPDVIDCGNSRCRKRRAARQQNI